MPRRTRALLLALLAACARAPEDSTVDAVEAVEASEARVVRTDRADLPVAELEPEQLTRFREGDGLFEAVYREVDGLGPAYIRASCSDCHREDGRGPGVVTRVVQTSPIGASLVQAGWSPASPLGDTERPYVTAGATIPLLFPDGPEIRRTQRLPPAVFGRGLLEAIADAEIERLARAAADRDGPVRGRIARVRLPGASEELIGRFGAQPRQELLGLRQRRDEDALGHREQLDELRIADRVDHRRSVLARHDQTRATQQADVV